MLMSKLGYEKFENWPSLYWYQQDNTLILVPVDDFKFDGPEDAV